MAQGGASHASLAELLTARGTAGISEQEAWAILCQAVQALQDLFLSDGLDGVGRHGPPLIWPGSLLLTCRGRVSLSAALGSRLPVPPHLAGYVAPEHRPTKAHTDTDIEKMLVFSLGETLKRATLTSHQVTVQLSAELCAVLTAMGKQLADERASLMHLLDVISEYSRRKEQTKPFSHTIMDLYRETIIYMNALPDLQEAALDVRLRNLPVEPYNNRNLLLRANHHMTNSTIAQKWSNFNLDRHTAVDAKLFSNLEPLSALHATDATATRPRTKCINRETTDVVGQHPRKRPNRRQPVKRAASRLYRASDADSGNDNVQKSCVGPEFVIRASLPCKKLCLEDTKGENIKKIIVIMLNGVKLEITCRPDTTTAGQLFEKIVQTENIEENFFLGLSVVIAGDFVFLPSDVKVSKILTSEHGTDTMFVRVRFFLPSLRGIRNQQSRHLLYLQLRKSLLENQLTCSINQMYELGGLALQGEFGDFTDKHKTSHYFLLEHYIPEILLENHKNVEHIRESLIRAHIQRSGLNTEKAEEIFILQTQSLPNYGFHLYSATWIAKNKQKDIWLCVSAKGLNLFDRNGCILNSNSIAHETFKWQSIQTLCYSKHYLCILPHNTQCRKTLPRKYKLKMDHKKSYYVFRLASLHHQFFLRLRTEYSSLQPISQQFGVLLKELKNETNSLFKLGALEKPLDSTSDQDKQENPDTEFKILLSDFKHNTKLDKIKCKRSKSVNELNNDKIIPLEEYQNKENENPRDINTKDSIPECNFINLPQTGNWDKRKGVLMGTRAFSSTGQRVSRSLEAVNAWNNEGSEKFSSQLSNASSINPLTTDAYVLNSTIKSCDDEFLPNFQETLSESLMNKLKNLSFADERILKSVIVFRDALGSLGVQVTEGSDGKAYIQSVVIGGPASLTNNIFKGDQIVAVNGQNLLNVKYADALEFLKHTGPKVELVLSQISSSVLMHNASKNMMDVDTHKTYPDTYHNCLKMANSTSGILCNSRMRYRNCNVDKKYISCTCNCTYNIAKDYNDRHVKMIEGSAESELLKPNNILDKELNIISCNSTDKNLLHRQENAYEGSKSSNYNMCSNLNYKDCDIVKKPFNEIALPRSLGLGRRWKGPVRYPVTPIKKTTSQSDSDSSFFLNASDEEQIFI